jgi:hypothetical protein
MTPLTYIEEGTHFIHNLDPLMVMCHIQMHVKNRDMLDHGGPFVYLLWGFSLSKFQLLWLKISGMTPLTYIEVGLHFTPNFTSLRVMYHIQMHVKNCTELKGTVVSRLLLVTFILWLHI